jgi:Heterokaryon incompatibility protein (HET)
MPFWNYTSPPEDTTPAAKECIPSLGLRARSLVSLHGRYQYKPLGHQKEIRMLQLHHRIHKNTIIQCNMELFLPHSSPSYVTLFYTWADPDVSFSLTSDILINDKLFAVTGNLYQFLCVQSFDHDFCCGTWLWIDQICIDQTNIQERNEQVARMGHVYRSAKTTIIRLGSGVEETDSYNADWAFENDSEFLTSDCATAIAGNCTVCHFACL